MTTTSSERVVHELDELIHDINTHLPDVSGRDTLLRACTRERSVMQQLRNSPSSTRKAVSSNLPHFKAIFRLANAYGHRLIGLLCRYRMPPATGKTTLRPQELDATESLCSPESPSSLVSSDSLSSDSDGEESVVLQREYRNLGVLAHQKRPSCVVVDLLCLQDETQGRTSADTRCPGNAPDADLWAPLLWIKAVNRDADRLNSVWRGQSLCTRTSCLSVQAEEMASTALWYQRDQSSGEGIKIVFHWLPSTVEPCLDRLDPGLVTALRQLKVSLMIGSAPWSLAVHGDHEKVAGTLYQSNLSLKQLMLSNQKLTDILLKPIVGDFREYKFGVLSQLLEFFQTESRVGGEEKVPVQSVMRNHFVPVKDCLNALLSRCFVYPYSSQVWERLDTVKRVNLDTTALISMTTEIAHFLPNRAERSSFPPAAHTTVDSEDENVLRLLSSDIRQSELLSMQPFKCAKMDWVRQAEVEQPVLLSIVRGIHDSVLMVCQTAVISFVGILAYVAGPSEWLRGVHLVSRLAVLPDHVVEQSLVSCHDNGRSVPAPVKKPSVTKRNNKQRTKVNPFSLPWRRCTTLILRQHKYIFDRTL